jgi:predicted nucleotide-binding protein
MSKINQKLLDAIIAKTDLNKRQVYKRIQQVTQTDYLQRSLAAIKVGAEVGLAINKYATAEELAQLRQTGGPVAPPPPSPVTVAAVRSAETKTEKRMSKKANKAVPNQVFVVHGRDRIAKDSTFAFLRAIGVKPIEWNSAIAMSKKPAPYISEILNAVFSKARAVVVLLTPDDLAQLRTDLIATSDPAFERRPMGQARPNVLFEAGMAFSSHPDRTVMVQVGNVRPFSDTAGRHVVHMSDEYAKRQELATKLKNAGCDVDTSGSDWVSAGDFTDPETRTPTVKTKRRA